MPRATEVRYCDGGVLSVGPDAIHHNGADLWVVRLHVREERLMRGDSKSDALSATSKRGDTAGGASRPRSGMCVFMMTSVTAKRGFLVAFGATVSSMMLSVRLSEPRDRVVSPAMSVVMLLSGALISVSSVHFECAVCFFAVFDETPNLEMFVRIENCGGSAWRKLLEKETLWIFGE